MSKYEVDEENFRVALEEVRKNHKLFDKALSRNWTPDFQKAIETWHTACLELGIGEGYVEHILEEHPEDDIILRMESVLAEQANDYYLAVLEEDEPAEDTDIIKKIISKALEGLTPDKQAEVLSKLKEAAQAMGDAAQE